MRESIVDHKINKSAFVYAASSYITLLRGHIEKENNILFPMGDMRLSESAQKEFLENFESCRINPCHILNLIDRNADRP